MLRRRNLIFRRMSQLEFLLEDILVQLEDISYKFTLLINRLDKLEKSKKNGK